MSYQRTGSCDRCGMCCKPPEMAAAHMLNIAKTQCKYLIDEGGGIHSCEITSGVFTDPEDTEATELLPEEDVAYWSQECQPYPNPENEAHCPDYHTLCGACTFTIGEV